MEREIVNKAYIPVYVLEKETECEPWHQLFATMDNYGHVEAKWVVTQYGEIICGDLLSSFLEDVAGYDGYVVRRPIVIDKFTEDPDELRALAEKLTY